MIRSYLEAIILSSLIRIKEERTVYAVFHLLKGKKSSQTIQDLHLYKLTSFFRMYPEISRDEFIVVIDHFQENDWISIKGEKGEYEVSVKAQQALDDFYKNHSTLPYLNGYKYHNQTVLFWKRFSLLFQVLSNSAYQHTKYYVVQRDLAIQNWVKLFLKQYPEREQVTKQLYEELDAVLATLPDEQATIFVWRLSGYGRVGYSYQQIAEIEELEVIDVYLLFVHVLHRLLQHAAEQKESIISAIVTDIVNEEASTITNSAVVTYKYVKNGFLIEEIARKRGLKENTIEDHIVELVLHQHITDISQYVDDEQLNHIIQIVKTKNTRQLKHIRQLLHESVSYFQIRLALAKGGAY